MLIIKVDYKNSNARIINEFEKYMRRWLNTTLSHLHVDYEVFPTSLTLMVKNVKDIKVIEDVIDSFIKYNNIYVINYINACPSENKGVYKTIVFEAPKPKTKVLASFNRNTGEGHYTEDFVNEIVDKVVARLNIKQGATYADAVEAIINDHDLWDVDKTEIMSWLPAGLDSDIYQAIINVTNSTLYGTSKGDVIVYIAKKAEGIMDNK